MNTELLTVNELADILRVHPDTVTAMCRRGAIRYYNVGGKYRFSQDHIAEYLDAQESKQRKSAKGGK